MARGVRHSDELRAQVQAALISGLSLAEAARRYNLSKSVVSSIRESIDKAKLEQVRTENQESISEALKNAVIENLSFQRAVLRVTSDENYIRTQNAGDLAKLVEVSQNYSVRLLEAASGSSEEEEED